MVSKYEKRIQDWLLTYYQQNKSFLKDYCKSGWDEFEFGTQDFVRYFEKHMKDMKRESGVNAGFSPDLISSIL